MRSRYFADDAFWLMLACYIVPAVLVFLFVGVQMADFMDKVVFWFVIAGWCWFVYLLIEGV